MAAWHLITCEFPPLPGGVSEHSRVLARQAAERGIEVHVWAPAGAGSCEGVAVHATLGGFGRGDLVETARQLARYSGPKRFVLQWVPHGYGRRGLNLAFSRWIRDLVGGDDELDVIVHEPFVDFLGPSVLQPLRAVVQRCMARTVLRGAHRTWLSIPGWASRLRSPLVGLAATPRVLPISGTIPIDGDREAINRMGETLHALGRERIVGYFGAGGEYAERALLTAARELLAGDSGIAILCVGRGSGTVALTLRRALPDRASRIMETGEVPLATISQAMQHCEVLIQPYPDGVSGRRTTTISALEHGLPVATTFGELSEPFWRETPAVETSPAAEPGSLARNVLRLLDPARHRRARHAARTLYQERFAPAVALRPLFGE